MVTSTQCLFTSEKYIPCNIITWFFVQNTPPPTENSGSSTSSGGSSNYGTLGRGAGGSMASMMDEMAKTLARRRAAVSI